jgi:hypothetical protein
MDGLCIKDIYGQGKRALIESSIVLLRKFATF